MLSRSRNFLRDTSETGQRVTARAGVCPPVEEPMKEGRRFTFHCIARGRLLPALMATVAITGAGLAVRMAAAAGPVSFQKQVQPILQRRCQGCHQPANRSGKLVVTS